ncbi:27234_t:CDS:2, partial [Gigaspora margarita]
EEVVHLPSSDTMFPQDVHPVEPQKKRTTIEEIQQLNAKLKSISENKLVTKDATKSAEVEETIYLSSHIKVSIQEVYLETLCPSATIGDLELYYVLELLEENDSADLVTDKEGLEKKDVELDPGIVLKNLINNYLEVVKDCGPYNLKSCSQNDASAIKDKRIGFELDPIKDKCSETKDLGGLDDNYPQYLNMNIWPNSIEPVLKSKVDNNCALIKMDDSIKTNGSNGIVVMRKQKETSLKYKKKYHQKPQQYQNDRSQKMKHQVKK